MGRLATDDPRDRLIRELFGGGAVAAEPPSGAGLSNDPRDRMIDEMFGGGAVAAEPRSGVGPAVPAFSTQTAGMSAMQREIAASMARGVTGGGVVADRVGIVGSPLRLRRADLFGLPGSMDASQGAPFDPGSVPDLATVGEELVNAPQRAALSMLAGGARLGQGAAVVGSRIPRAAGVAAAAATGLADDLLDDPMRSAIAAAGGLPTPTALARATEAARFPRTASEMLVDAAVAPALGVAADRLVAAAEAKRTGATERFSPAWFAGAIGEQLPTLLPTLVPGVGVAARAALSAPMFLRMAGDQAETIYRDQVEAGMPAGQAAAYALSPAVLTGAFNAAIERLGGLQRLASGGIRGGAVRQFAASSAQEVGEELVQGVTERGVRKATTGRGDVIDPQAMGDEAAIAAAMSTLLGAPLALSRRPNRDPLDPPESVVPASVPEPVPEVMPPTTEPIIEPQPVVDEPAKPPPPPEVKGTPGPFTRAGIESRLEKAYAELGLEEQVPMDRGSLVRGEVSDEPVTDDADYDEVPFSPIRDVPGQLDLGSRDVGPATGSQRTIFGDAAGTGKESPPSPLAADAPRRPDESEADYRLRRKFREAEAKTGALFSRAKSPTGNVTPTHDAKWTPSSAPRVPVAAVAGGEAKPLRDMILNLGKAAGRRVRRAKPGRGAGGTYYPGSARTVIRFAGDLDTTAHEVAHAIDDRFSIVGAWAGDRRASPFDDELIPHFSQHGSTTKTGPRSKLLYMRAEGVAEWVRAWMVNPAEAVAAAPKFAAHFDKAVPEKVRKSLRAFGDDVRAWAGASATEQTLSNVELRLTPRGLRDAVAARFESEGVGSEPITKLSTTMNDALAPLWKGVELARRLRGIADLLPRSNPVTLIRLFAGFDRKFMDVVSHGPITAKGVRVTGLGGVDWLLEPMKGDRAQVVDDLRATIAFGLSERVVEKAEQWAALARSIEDEAKKLASLRARHVEAVDPADLAELAGQIADSGTIIDKLKKQLGYSGHPAGALAWVARRAARMSGAGGGIFSDLDTARKVLEELASDPARLGRVKEAASRYRKWSDAVLQYMVDKGRISQQRADEVRAANSTYFAMKRLMDSIDPTIGSAGTRRLASVKETIHRFVGSTRTIENPYVSLMEQTYAMMREADRNEGLRAVRDLLTLDRGMYQGAQIDLDQIGSKAADGDEDAVKVFVDGELERWQFAPDIHRTLKDFGSTSASNLVYSTLQLPARLLRAGVTLSPPFLVRNILRDPVARTVLSRTGSTPWGHLFGMRDLDKTLSEFYRFGGGQFGYYLGDKDAYYQHLQKAIRKASGSGKTVVAFPADLARAYKRFSEMSETLGRLAEFRSALKAAKAKGYDDYDAHLFAAFQARDLQDFAQAGTVAREINKYVPFFSAQIRGMVRAVRVGSGREGGAAAARFWAKWMAVVAAPTAVEYMIAALSGYDDEWRQLPAYQKDMFWNFKIGPDAWLSIPKPWEMGALASGISRGIDWARGNKRAFAGYAHSLHGATSPVDVSDMLGPYKTFGEVIANYDFFRQKQIVPWYEEGLRLDKRDVAANASRSARTLQPIIGADARKIDHFIQGQLGGLGRLAVQASDVGSPGAATRLGMTASGILRRGGVNGPDVDWVMTWARREGVENDVRVRDLRRLVGRYYDATTATERDQAAQRVRDRAAAIREQVDR